MGEHLISTQKCPPALLPWAHGDSAALEGRPALCGACEWVPFAFSGLVHFSLDVNSFSAWTRAPLGNGALHPPLLCPPKVSFTAGTGNLGVCSQGEQAIGLCGRCARKGRAVWTYVRWLYVNLLPHSPLLLTSALGAETGFPKLKLHVLKSKDTQQNYFAQPLVAYNS